MPSGPGRPLKGKEPRVKVSFRMEPTVRAEIERMTGLSLSELIPRLHSLLKFTSECRREKVRMNAAMLVRLESLIAEPLDKAS